ncbi:hypothetical protein BaRGS_00006669 [Batillaria attramentaria]|uniref:Uncharacterized protein n=1 Tax=Batillaria attramentaria TaxID=370345 RepID=A0ABD0LR27_9CAEN
MHTGHWMSILDVQTVREIDDQTPSGRMNVIAVSQDNPGYLYEQTPGSNFPRSHDTSRASYHKRQAHQRQPCRERNVRRQLFQRMPKQIRLEPPRSETNDVWRKYSACVATYAGSEPGETIAPRGRNQMALTALGRGRGEKIEVGDLE